MYRKILVPTDGSDLSNKALIEAARLAQCLGAKVLVLHVRSPIEVPHHVEGGALSELGEARIMGEIEDEERELLDKAMVLAGAGGAEVETAFVVGYRPFEAIIRISREQQCDLIVMASHGRRGVTGLLLGSETQKVLSHLTATSVLVVR